VPVSVARAARDHGERAFARLNEGAEVSMLRVDGEIGPHQRLLRLERDFSRQADHLGAVLCPDGTGFDIGDGNLPCREHVLLDHCFAFDGLDDHEQLDQFTA
jgi:hypothetical protein